MRLALENSYWKIENSMEVGEWKIVKRLEKGKQTHFLISAFYTIFHFLYY